MVNVALHHPVFPIEPRTFWHAICAKPLGEAKEAELRVGFDSRLKLKFVGSKITSDAGLLAYRELDEVLSLTEMGAEVLTDLRLGTNKQRG